MIESTSRLGLLCETIVIKHIARFIIFGAMKEKLVVDP